MYIGIIADIIASRKIEDRDLIQKRLKEALEEGNQLFKDDMASNFTITIGDEFQGLLKDASRLMEVIEFLKFKLFPVKLRIGVGFGEIRTEINKEMAIGADGPAYYMAREGVDDLKDADDKAKKIESNIKLLVDTYSRNPVTNHETEINKKDNQLNKAERLVSLIEMINGVLALLYFIEKDWDEKDYQIYELYRLKQYNQKEIAALIGATQSAVSKRINKSGFMNYVYMINQVQKQIDNIWREINE